VRRKRLTSMLAIAVSAVALLAAGCTSAAATAPAATAPAATAPAATAPAATAPAAKAPAAGATSAAKTPAAGGAAHIIDYSLNSDGPDSRVILTGAIGDWGQVVAVYPDGAIDPGHTSEFRLELTHGSFRLSIASLHKKIIRAFSPWPSNKSTCSGSVSFTVTIPVVAGSGTGAYRGISGSFTVTVTIDEVDVKPVCDGSSAFLAQVILIAGPGTVSFS
jgi:hypothetical protein